MAQDQKMKLGTLTAMVVGGMVGAGVFSLPRNFAQATGVYGGWSLDWSATPLTPAFERRI